MTPHVMTDEHAPAGEPDLDDLRMRLERLQRTSTPWAIAALRLIEKYPGVNSAALARRAGTDLSSCKSALRTLQHLGLVERTGTGHRLSSVGAALLQSPS